MIKSLVLIIIFSELVCLFYEYKFDVFRVFDLKCFFVFLFCFDLSMVYIFVFQCYNKIIYFLVGFLFRR